MMIDNIVKNIKTSHFNWGFLELFFQKEHTEILVYRCSDTHSQVKVREVSHQVNISSESLSTPQSVYAAAETGFHITNISLRG
jgi:hypothetical protein